MADELLKRLEQNDLTNECAMAFKEIAKLYYSSNFGTSTKSVIDSLMFKYIMEFVAPEMDDYDLANQLGITEARIRNKKMDCTVRYRLGSADIENELKESLRRCVKNKDEDKITIAIPNLELVRQIERIGAKHRLVLEFDRYKTYVALKRSHFVFLCCVVFGYVDQNGNVTKEMQDKVFKLIEQSSDLTAEEKKEITGNGVMKGLAWVCTNVVTPLVVDVLKVKLGIT